MTTFLNAESELGANSEQETSSSTSSGAETTTNPGTKCSRKTCIRIAKGGFKLCETCREVNRGSALRAQKRKADAMKKDPELKYCSTKGCMKLVEDKKFSTCKNCREIVQRALEKQLTREPKEGCFVCHGCTHDKPIELKPDGTQYKLCKPCREKHNKYHEENMCPHGKEPSKCSECLTQDQIGEKLGLCDGCGKRVHGDRRKDRGGPGLCAECDKKSFQRIEHKVRDRLIKNDFAYAPSSADNKMLGGKKCPKVPVTRPDLSFVGKDRVLYVEVDEYEHKGYDVSCEQRKFCGAKWGLAEDLRVLPTILIRFNPHGGPFEDVLERLMEVVYKYRTTPIADLNLHPRHDLVTNAVYMFYTPTSKHIRNANEQASIHIAELVGESQKHPKKARVSAAD